MTTTTRNPTPTNRPRSPYDAVAWRYDDHFRRPVDRWEDDRLRALLAPFVGSRNVLDLGCGTGWLLDHLRPANYVGVDESAAMLARLHEKHPHVWTARAAVGVPGWAARLVGLEGIETVTATWSAHELGDLGTLLAELRALFGPVDVLLHGQGRRYRHRSHYVLDGNDPWEHYRSFTPAACREAARAAGVRLVNVRGIGAMPDSLARSEFAWRLALGVPARFHWSFMARFRL